jgi:hypothetical protein
MTPSFIVRTEYAHTTKKVKCCETLITATARFCREMYDGIHEVIHNAVPHAWEGAALQPAWLVVSFNLHDGFPLN